MDNDVKIIEHELRRKMVLCLAWSRESMTLLIRMQQIETKLIPNVSEDWTHHVHSRNF